MRTVAIVGVGLIGASFGLAIRKSGFDGTILGVSSPAAIEAGLAAGAISSSATLREAAEKADLIYLAQPVDRIIETLGWLGPLARQETLITDAGSTKSSIVQAASSYLHAPFVGGHPMAGKESRGAASADADLFRNRLYIVTSELPETFRQLLESIGANIVYMSAEQHDATVALTSHLPQLLSTALASCVAKEKHPEIQLIFGSGLLDMTRLAMSSAELWSSILTTNKENVLNALRSYTDSLHEIEEAIQADDLEAIFNQASQLAANLRKPAY